MPEKCHPQINSLGLRELQVGIRGHAHMNAGVSKHIHNVHAGVTTFPEDLHYCWSSGPRFYDTLVSCVLTAHVVFK